MAVNATLLARHVERRYGCTEHGYHDVTIELWSVRGSVFTHETGACDPVSVYSFLN